VITTTEVAVAAAEVDVADAADAVVEEGVVAEEAVADAGVVEETDPRL